MPSLIPTIVFVPGAWHEPTIFNDVRAELGNLKFPTVAIANPSVGSTSQPLKNLTDDVSNLHSVIMELVNSGDMVVVVAHSYGGVVASGAAQDLAFAQRAAAGQKGGIIMMVYLAAFAIPAGETLLGAAGGVPPSWWEQEGDQIYANNPIISDPAYHFYNDLPSNVQDYWISRLLPLAAADVTIPAIYEPWKDMPCTYVFTEQDNAIAPVVQQAMAAGMGKITTATLNASHSPFLSMPNKVVEVIQQAAKEGVRVALG
ncbi:Uncharacterized protein BP5553_03137 [Venustampulla echinocandica]|uniref:AB hydrolase-1 domain-containing protein n=1 Tax=Venustampulla echinocandica TaxID=2656787 RepID=A0A370TTE0_9HELO|nr:Uncharacterized protein BP5553_03137 [Venustampulla echinocandica]RDL38797.1 Uncharacterized protein BP5553_03137 [Venustampulla echinocandica]